MAGPTATRSLAICLYKNVLTHVEQRTYPCPALTRHRASGNADDCLTEGTEKISGTSVMPKTHRLALFLTGQSRALTQRFIRLHSHSPHDDTNYKASVNSWLTFLCSLRNVSLNKRSILRIWLLKDCANLHSRMQWAHLEVPFSAIFCRSSKR